MMEKRREPARWIFAKEMRDTSLTFVEGEDDARKEYFITPLGSFGRRILICGKITQKTQENEMVKFTVADHTGAFYITFFSKDFNQNTKLQIDLVSENDVVVLMGRTSYFRSNEGKMYININPEYVRKVNETDAEYWKARTSKSLKDRLYAIKEIRKSPDMDLNHLMELGLTEDEAKGCLKASTVYDNYNIGPLEEIIAGMSSYQFSDAALKIKDKIFGIIKENTPFGGITYDQILERVSKEGIEARQLDETLNMLGTDGEIYEAEKRKFKVI
ncbi:MAG: hypothetical protein M1498_02100 [Candidatus Thermoplasmatota archaeon]|nr:hypothetical protein [Candidatus Thermoplasmatota archaeon]MCL5889295.1 hypothetical protein [Candidatus Thermoplasmatota archaeon]